jgi:hypothetical protein
MPRLRAGPRSIKAGRSERKSILKLYRKTNFPVKNIHQFIKPGPMKPPFFWALLLAAVALTVADPHQAAAQATPVDAPAAFDVADRAAILVVHATGAQIYECKVDASGAANWVFREPIATLIRDGGTIGHHYVGPTWELADGEVVRGKQSAVAPGATPSDVALLKLDVAEYRGNGALKDARLVLRLNTRGGVLKGECQKAGQLRAEPYSADYAFLR